MLETVLIVLHVVVSLFLIFVVLLQSGQAADLAGAFGGGGSQTALGMRGAATLLQKVTTASAVIFMLTSLSLGIVGRGESSIIEGLAPPPAESSTGVEQGTGEEQQGTGEEQQGTGEEQQGAGEEQQGAGESDPGAGEQSGEEGQGSGEQRRVPS